MADASSIAAAVAGLQTAFSITKGILELKIDARIRDQAIKLQEAILATQKELFDAQQNQFAMADEVRTLRAKLTEFENWEDRAQCYELTELPPGIFVYSIKDESRGSAPAHYVCATCFNRRTISYLNKDEPSMGLTNLHCPACGWHDLFGRYVPSEL